MAQSNKLIVQRYIDAFNRGDLDGVCACFSADAVVHGIQGWGPLDVVRPVWKQLIESLRLHFREAVLIEEGDVVCARFAEQGESVRPFLHFPATGRRFESTAIEWFEIDAGLIRRRWGVRDSGSIFRQLGFSPG